MSLLAEYIDTCRKKGISDDQINRELHVSGYTSKMIDEAFQDPGKTPVLKERSSIFKIALIISPYVLVLIVLSYTGFYFFSAKSNSKAKISITAQNSQANNLNSNSNASTAEIKLKIESFSFGKISSGSAILMSPQRTKIIIAQSPLNQAPLSEIRSTQPCEACSQYDPSEVKFDASDNLVGKTFLKLEPASPTREMDFLHDGIINKNFSVLAQGFSENKKHIGFIGTTLAKSNDIPQPSSYPLVIDNKQVEKVSFSDVSKECPCQLFISNNGQSYVLMKKAENNQYSLVFNGKDLGTSFEPNSLSFSPDGTKIALEAKKPDRKYAVTIIGKNGQTEYPSYDGQITPLKNLKGIIFSADSSRIAYVQGDGNNYNLIVDGKQQSISKVAINDFVFSDDSKNFLYDAYVDDQNTGIFLNGNILAKSDKDNIATNFMFIPKTNKIAYVSQTNTVTHQTSFTARAVIDGKIGKDYQGLISNLTFNQDGTRYFYIPYQIEKKGGSPYSTIYSNKLILDEKETASNVLATMFSSDGKHIAYYVSNGPIQALYTYYPTNPELYLDSNKIDIGQQYLQFPQVNGNQWKYDVNPKINNGYIDPIFTEDSKQFKFTSKKEDEIFLNVVTIL